ncbi:hypothetical protein R1sor_020704 [Riccia sorocarpa]|uniref:Remorin C-terminal domain-containing protein n=1 Tax=Riccia sorocarpa TaxID=122646 RepID=A0ABD3GEZ3_9MARC
MFWVHSAQSEAVKAWLESSPKSVIGVRGRSPTETPRSSVSSPDRAAANPRDGELDPARCDGGSQSPSFQRSKLTPWTNVVGGEGGNEHKESRTPAEVETIAGKQLCQEEKPAVEPNKSLSPEEGRLEVDVEEDNYSHAVTEALRSTSAAPESYLKPPRVLEKAIVLYEGGQEKQDNLPGKLSFYIQSEDFMDEIRGKELEDYPTREVYERRPSNREYGIAAVDSSCNDSPSDFESSGEEVHDKSGFTSSAMSTPFSILEERRSGGEGMHPVQMAELQVSESERSKVTPGIDSSPVAQEFDSVAENRRPVKHVQSRRATQPLYGTDLTQPPTSRQGGLYGTESRSSRGLFYGGRWDGTTKASSVAPVSEDSRSSCGSMRSRRATPLEGVDSNQVQLGNQFERQPTVERVRKEKFSMKAAAWEEAKNLQYLNRYKQEETKIMAWEDHKKAKAEVNLKRLETKLREKREKAIAKMQSELAKAQMKAEQKKATAEAKRAEKAARAAEEADRIRHYGRLPFALFCFSP